MKLSRKLWTTTSTTLMILLTFLSVLTGYPFDISAKSGHQVHASSSRLSEITQDGIIARAKSWVDAHIPYNQRGYYQGYREDCSGLVSQAWQLMANQQPKSLSTYTLPTVSHSITKDALQTGDILLNQWGGWTIYGSPDAHVVLFDSWVNSSHTLYNGYEESDYYGGAHFTTNIPYPYWPGYDPSDFTPMRFNDLSTTPPPSLSQPTLYLSSQQDGNIYALNASNGNVRWKYSFNSLAISSLHVVDDVIYFILDEDINTNPTATSTMYELNAQDGSVIHHFKLPYFTLETGAFIPPFTVGNGTIFLNSPQMVFAIDSSNGNVVWHYPWFGRGASDPILLNNIVYSVTGVGVIYALNGTDGTVLWKYDLGLTPLGSIMGRYPDPVIVNNTFYVTGWFTDTMYAISLNTHTERWHIHLNHEQTGYTYTNGQNIYVTTSNFSANTNSTYELNPIDGTQLWQKANVDVLLANNNILYGTDNTNHVVAVQAADGAILWETQIPANGLAIANGILYVSTSDSLYALPESGGSPLWTVALPYSALAKTP